MVNNTRRPYTGAMGHPTEKEIVAIFAENPSFSQLSSSSCQALAACCALGRYKTNQNLWHFGDPAEFCVLIVSGLVEITRSSGTEEEASVGIFGKNDVLGLSAAMKKTTYPGNAKVLDDTKVIKFYLRPLLSEKDPKKANLEIAEWCREMMIQHEQILREKICILTAGATEDRLLELLKHLLRRFGKIKSGCKYEIQIRLTKSKAAKLMGIRNETAIRLINSWQKQNLLTWKSDRIIVQDLDLIERFVVTQRSGR